MPSSFIFVICFREERHDIIHPRRPRDGQSGGEKMCDESFHAQAEKPPGTDSHWTISKRSSECWLLIRHKKYFVLLFSIGEQHLLNSFCEFVHDGYWLDHGLSGSCTKEMHAVRKLSVWYKLSISKYCLPENWRSFSKNTSLSLQQVFTLTSITHSMPRQPTATKTSHEKWIHIFSVSVVIIPTSQEPINSSGAEFLSTRSKFIKRKKILSLLVYVLHKTWN